MFDKQVKHHRRTRPLAAARKVTSVRGKKVALDPLEKQRLLAMLLKPGPDLVIADEGHILRNDTSKITQCTAIDLVHGIRRQGGDGGDGGCAKYNLSAHSHQPNACPRPATGLKQLRTPRRVCLTGYPLQNKLGEYRTMVDWVRPGLLGTRDDFFFLFEKQVLSHVCDVCSGLPVCHVMFVCL